MNQTSYSSATVFGGGTVIDICLVRVNQEERGSKCSGSKCQRGGF